MCGNRHCREFGKEHHNTEWNADLGIDVFPLPCDVCHGPRAMTKMRFKQCHMQLLMQTQPQSGESQWTASDTDCPGEVDVPLTQSALAVQVSTAILPKLEMPV